MFTFSVTLNAPKWKFNVAKKWPWSQPEIFVVRQGWRVDIWHSAVVNGKAGANLYTLHQISHVMRHHAAMVVTHLALHWSRYNAPVGSEKSPLCFPHAIT